MILKFTPNAVSDLIRLREFIAKNNPENAIKVSNKIIKSIENITSTPFIGKNLDSFSDDIRELNIGRYVFRYLVEKNTITILRMWHGRELKQ